jgi:UDP-glucose 4-epimerase
MNSVLVTGAAGYIGSEVSSQLLALGYEVVGIDNLSTGDKRRIPDSLNFFKADIADSATINKIAENFNFRTVMHFAAHKQARESNTSPSLYWTNNVQKLNVFLNCLSKMKIDNIILSSSCSVYGNGGKVDKYSPLSPVSTYGWTKLASEKICQDFARQYEWNYLGFRYFNVIGASTRPYAGDFTSQCVVPTVFNKITSHLPFYLLGDDFDTPDGSAVRDYIDVRDVASAHVLSFKFLAEANGLNINISSGVPTSVKQLIALCERSSNSEVIIETKARNLSDPSEIWTDCDPILAKYGWKPSHDIERMISDHWDSFKRFTNFENS